MSSPVLFELTFDNPEVTIVAEDIVGTVSLTVYAGTALSQVFHSLLTSPVFKGTVIQDGV